MNSGARPAMWLSTVKLTPAMIEAMRKYLEEKKHDIKR